MATADPNVNPADDVTLAKAKARDADALADISERAFNSDVDCGAPGPGGPPGYDQPGNYSATGAAGMKGFPSKAS